MIEILPSIDKEYLLENNEELRNEVFREREGIKARFFELRKQIASQTSLLGKIRLDCSKSLW